MSLKQFACNLAIIGVLYIGATMATDAGSGEEVQYRHRAEFKMLYSEDIPYARYIRAIADHVEEEWPHLDDGGRGGRATYEYRVYLPLVHALRDLSPQANGLRRHRAAQRIAAAFESDLIELEDLQTQFNQELFQEEWFQQSASAYRDAVIDLWQRFERREIPIPARRLLLLNQPTIGHPDGQSHFSMDVEIGDFYTQLGEHEAAAHWYLKVPPAGLGPLKAADAYYLAGNEVESQRLYRSILDGFDDWVTLRDRLREERFVAAPLPLARANLEEIRLHVAERLIVIEQKRQ